MPRGIPKNGKRKSRKSAVETPQETVEPAVDFQQKMLEYAHAGHVALNTIAQLLAERNDLLKEFQAGQKERDERVVQALESGSLTITGDTKLEVTPPKKERAKKPTEPPPCQHTDLEPLSRPGLARCKACNAVIDVPIPEATAIEAMKAAKAERAITDKAASMGNEAPKPVQPAAKATVEVPKDISVEDLRAAAIGFASKHGKPALAEMLKKYGATNISSVPAESRAALIDELGKA